MVSFEYVLWEYIDNRIVLIFYSLLCGGLSMSTSCFTISLVVLSWVVTLSKGASSSRHPCHGIEIDYHNWVTIQPWTDD